MDRYIAWQVLRHVAHEGSFAAAARRLGLSPAAVSKNVAELEAHVQARLFHRTTRRVSLTDEGRVYLDHVQRALDALADGEAALAAARAAPSGRLRVSAPLTVVMTLLAEAIPAFLAQQPQLQLELDLSDRRVDLVRDGFDMALRGTQHLEDSSLVARRLAELDYVLCAAPRYFAQHGTPQVPADLRQHTCLRFSYAGEHWEFVQDGRRERVSLSDARYSVSSSLAIIAALRAGFGVSVLPRAYVAGDLRDGVLVPALADWRMDSLTLYAVYPSREHLAPKIRAFIDFLQAALAPLDGGVPARAMRV